jgi:hypothetical protein
MDWTGELVSAKEKGAYGRLEGNHKVLDDCGFTITIDCDEYRDTRLIKKGFNLVGKEDDTDYVIKPKPQPELSYEKAKYIDYLRRGYDHDQAMRMAKQAERLRESEED